MFEDNNVRMFLYFTFNDKALNAEVVREIRYRMTICLVEDINKEAVV
jgi:hypothetical protein